MKKIDDHNVTDYYSVTAVLGASLTQNLVVSKRATAIIIAQTCRKMGINSITIEILEELESIPAYQPNATSGVPELRLTSLLECLHIIDRRIYPAIERRLRSWSFFDGVGHEVMKSRTRYIIFMSKRSYSKCLCYLYLGYAVYKYADR